MWGKSRTLVGPEHNEDAFRMVACLLIYMLGGTTAYYVALAYFIAATVFFLVRGFRDFSPITLLLQLRSLKTFILDTGYSPDGGRKRKLYLVLSITVFQSLVMWLLTRYASQGFAMMCKKWNLAA